MENLLLIRHQFLFKSIHFNSIPIHIAADILKIMWKCKGPGINKTILRKKNKLNSNTSSIQDLYSYSNYT